MNVKGATHFLDDVASAKSFGAPNLNGSTGNPFIYTMHGFIGALIGAGLMVALAYDGSVDIVRPARDAFAALRIAY